jgi:hypothetical protein
VKVKVLVFLGKTTGTCRLMAKLNGSPIITLYGPGRFVPVGQSQGDAAIAPVSGKAAKGATSGKAEEEVVEAGIGGGLVVS